MKKNKIKIPFVEKMRSGKIQLVRSSSKMKGKPFHRDGLFLIEFFDIKELKKRGDKKWEK